MTLRAGKIVDVRGFQGDRCTLDELWAQAATGALTVVAPAVAIPL